MRTQVKSLKNTVSYLRSNVRDKENETENQSNNFNNLMKNASLGKSFVFQNTLLTSEEIDRYLCNTLNVPVRDDDSFHDKVKADVRHQLYVLLKYCESSYPKLKLATKSGYSSKVIKNAESNAEALQLCLQNMMLFVYKHIPKVRNAVDQGI